MGYRDINKLFSESAGRCNFPDCKKMLFYEFKDKSFVSLGEICHIIGESPSGPRGHLKNSYILKNEEKNLILLCSEHHKIIDGNPEEYSIEELKQMKRYHLNWIKSRLDISKDTNWTFIIHTGNINKTGLAKIDEELIHKDLIGNFLISNVEKIETPEFLIESNNWLHYKKIQELWWENYQKFNDKPIKFLIFSINFIPLVIHLGYLLHDTSATEIHQFNRVKKTWRWQKYKKSEEIKEIFEIQSNVKEDSKLNKLAIAFCISGNIMDKDIFEALDDNIEIIRLKVKKPNRNWLNFREQLINFQKFFIEFIDNLVNTCTDLTEIHLFLSGPTPVAFVIGSSINPNMHPKFILYNYHRKSTPKYTRVFTLN